MIVKEEKANSFICPLMSSVSIKRNVGCFGKGCMCWRWWGEAKGYGYCGYASIPKIQILEEPAKEE